MSLIHDFYSRHVKTESFFVEKNVRMIPVFLFYTFCPDFVFYFLAYVPSYFAILPD